jgi:hypothetical protein
MAEKRNLEWGLQAPAEAKAAWGARAIFKRGPAIDIVFDRQDAFGDEEKVKDLVEWMRTTGLPMLEEATADLSPTSDQTVSIRRGKRNIKASPRRSHGYLYIVAWE